MSTASCSTLYLKLLVYIAIVNDNSIIGYKYEEFTSTTSLLSTGFENIWKRDKKACQWKTWSEKLNIISLQYCIFHDTSVR